MRYNPEMDCVDLEAAPYVHSEVILEAPVESTGDDYAAQLAAAACGADASLQEEVEARIQVVKKEVQERVQAAWQGRPPLLPGWLRAGRNIAMHNFAVLVAHTKAKDYCAIQRAGRRRGKGSASRPQAAGDRAQVRSLSWGWGFLLFLIAMLGLGGAASYVGGPIVQLYPPVRQAVATPAAVDYPAFPGPLTYAESLYLEMRRWRRQHQASYDSAVLRKIYGHRGARWRHKDGEYGADEGHDAD